MIVTFSNVVKEFNRYNYHTGQSIYGSDEDRSIQRGVSLSQLSTLDAVRDTRMQLIFMCLSQSVTPAPWIRATVLSGGENSSDFTAILPSAATT